MKQTIFLFLTAITVFTASAQQPEKIYSSGRVQHPTEWYQEQAIAWKKVLDKDPKNATAWYNYYYANRILGFHARDEKTAQERVAIIQQLIEDMGKQIPDTYEYNLVKYMSGGLDTKLLPYLEKAVALGEGRTEHLDFLINRGEMERNIPDRDLYTAQKYKAGEISTGMLYYNYNVMMGVATNTILITCGDNDTYPIWALQSQGIRKDITVVNLNLLRIDDYRAKLFKELGVDAYAVDTTKVSCDKYKKEIIKHIAANKKGYPVYIGLTAAGMEDYIHPVQENLYLTGLAYQYSETSIDNMAMMKRNFEQQYALDYIENPFYHDISRDMVDMINYNYAIPMLKLYEHYKISGDTEKQAWIRRKILAISKDSEEGKEIKAYLEQL